MRYSATPGNISGLYTGGNERFDSRQLGQMLYQEQKMREQRALQEDAAVSKMIQEDVGKVRSADVGLVTDMYGKVKEAKLNLMNPKIKNNPQLYSVAQLAHQKSMADYYATVRGSQEEKEKDKILATLKPDERGDEYGNLMAVRIKTPLNQLQRFKHNGKDLDLTNPDTFRYMGPNTDFGKIVRDVAGTPRQVYAETKSLDKLGLQSEITPYFYGNSPAQVYSGLLGSFSQRGAGRDAAMNWDALPKDEVNEVINKYANIPKDKLKRMGLDKPQELSDFSPTNKAENYARYLAMQYAVNNEPEARTPVYKTNEAVKRNLDLADQKSMAAFNSSLRKEEDALKEKAKGKSAEEQMNSLDQFISGIERRANESPTVWSVTDKSGKKQELKQVPLSPSLSKVFEKLDIYGDKTQPDALGINSDGEYVPIFYKKEAKTDESGKVTSWEYKKSKSGQGYEWDETKSTAIPKSVFKAELANTLLTPKMVAENLGDEGESKKKKTVGAIQNTFKLSKGALDDL